MRIEQKNMFTGEYDRVYDLDFEAEMDSLSLEPYLCPCCEKDWIEPQRSEYFDEDEDKVYEYYLHYCGQCGFEEYLNQDDEVVTDIIQKDRRREQEHKEYKKLYDRPLL